ncbi:MAG: hypothetical protein IPK22_19815 [Verrucomicrobiaceae bacterium]|nr:hypothetical protein [Verrucomicrobiaceae bacterium]
MALPGENGRRLAVAGPFLRARGIVPAPRGKILAARGTLRTLRDTLLDP